VVAKVNHKYPAKTEVRNVRTSVVSLDADGACQDIALGVCSSGMPLGGSGPTTSGRSRAAKASLVVDPVLDALRAGE
jgi:hypothetical protein